MSPLDVFGNGRKRPAKIAQRFDIHCLAVFVLVALLRSRSLANQGTKESRLSLLLQINVGAKDEIRIAFSPVT